MKLRRLFSLIFAAVVMLSPVSPVYAQDVAVSQTGEKRLSVTGEVVGISDDSITVLTKEKERVFSINGAVLGYPAGFLKKDTVKVIFTSRDRNTAREIRMVKPSEAHYENAVYLTFDDGPDAYNTPSIINTLIEYKAGATFFFTGKTMLAHKSVTKAAHDHGFAIGLHGYDHTAFTRLSADGLKNDIAKTNEALYGITGRYSGITRPPYGAINDSVRKTMASVNQKPVMWTLDTRDWVQKDSYEILRAVKNNLHPGANILMHSGGNGKLTAHILPQVIEYIRSQGYKLANMPEQFQDSQVKIF